MIPHIEHLESRNCPTTWAEVAQQQAEAQAALQGVIQEQREWWAALQASMDAQLATFQVRFADFAVSDSPAIAAAVQVEDATKLAALNEYADLAPAWEVYARESSEWWASVSDYLDGMRPPEPVQATDQWWAQPDSGLVAALLLDEDRR
jgi:hypothetical protein